MNTKLKASLSVVAIIITPLVLGQVLRIETGRYTIGDESAWVGFFGNYSGGIIGGIVAYLIASKENKQTKQQLKTIEEEKKQLEKQKQESLIDIINLFLKDEIDKNLNILIKDQHFSDYLEKHEEPFQLKHTNWEFDTSQFEQIKFEIIKYKNNALVRETLKIYKVFMILNRTKDINELSKEQYEDLKKNYYFWSGWINESEIVFS